MKQYPRWKYVLLVLVIGLGLIYALPNIFVEDPAVQISSHGGGNLNEQVLGDLEQALQAQQLSPKTVEQDGNQALFRFSTPEEQLQGKEIIRATLPEENYTVALNLASATPHWLQAVGGDPMKLGLDLRGGVHFLLAIDVDSLVERRLAGEQRGVGDTLRQEKIRYQSLKLVDGEQIVIQFSNKDEADIALRKIKPQFPELMWEKASLPSAGIVIRGTMSPAARVKTQDYAVDQTMTILRSRINELGVAEPIVQRQGADRIAVDLPGIQDTARAKQILGGTATIELKMVDTEHDAGAAAQGAVPGGATLYYYEKTPVLLKDRVILSGTSITGAVASIGGNGRPSVNIRLGGGGESMFGKIDYTAKKSERVISVPTIKSALGNNFQITGLSDPNESRNLALLLRSGALPAPISIIEESIVGPSLGKENIEKGVISVIVGFALIVLFMIFYYRLFGLLADVALGLNLILLVAILSILGATLTLPGIAGIVLTVGMAVDANVLIFERIREELRNGLSCHASIQAGFDKAFSTIVDANVTTLIAAIALFALGTGAVKGFAVTVTIGIVTSMFTAITATQALVHLVYDKRQVKKLSIGI